MSVTITYNGLTIQSDGPGFVVSRAEGFNGVENRVSRIDLLSRDGGRIFERKDSMRTIVLEGTIYGATEVEFFTNKALLMSAYNNKATSEFDVTLWDGTNRKIPMKVIQEPDPIYEGGFTTNARFQIILVAEDPYWQDSTDISVTMMLEQVQGFDLPVDLSFDILSGGNEDTEVIDNTGQVAIYPRITITAGASLINPTVTNQSTGESVQINGTLLAGDVVIIEWGPSGETVTKNGSINYYEFLIGNLFKLQLGTNILRFTASSFDTLSIATVEYNLAYRSF